MRIPEKLTFRDIVTLLTINAPVNYTSRNELDEENYVSCRYMGNAEADAIKTGTHSTECHYDSSDVGLHFPDTTVNEYYILEKQRNPVAIESCIGRISFQMKVFPCEIPIVHSVYCVLHEYGHWLHFMESGKTTYEYERLEYAARQPYEKTANQIRALPDGAYKRILARRYEDEIYSQFPSERAADEYALKHIVEAVTIIRDFLGYTEQDLICSNRHHAPFSIKDEPLSQA